MMLRYTVFMLSFISVIVFIKSILLPYLIWRLLPQSDFSSTLYEIMVMVWGTVMFLGYLALGYIGKNVYRLNGLQHQIVQTATMLPLFLYTFALELNDVLPSTLLGYFLSQWGGLLGEPIRLLFLVYPWTDSLAVALSWGLLSLGRRLQLVEDKNLPSFSYAKPSS